MNTAEEAQAVAALLSQRHIVGAVQGAYPHILLVTSAFHMSRAQHLFARAGLEVTPFPVDFQVSTGGELSVMDFLPNAGDLAQTERACREMYSRFYYGVRSVFSN